MASNTYCMVCAWVARAFARAGESLVKLGEFSRRLLELQAEQREAVSKASLGLKKSLKLTGPTEVKKVMDKAVKQYEKDRSKKKGSLEMRTVAMETSQRTLQKQTVECMITMQQVRRS